MKKLAPGEQLDGFKVVECLHAGGMAHVYQITYADDSTPGFEMAMKVPKMTAGDGAENIVGFEVELQILQVLEGPHIPRFVAAGDLETMPYLVMEYVKGKTLDHWVEQATKISTAEICQLGTAVALAMHSLHQQNAVHLDLKPANIIIKENGSAVLLDFGLSYHAHYPDLLAEQLRKAVGSPAWISPEQVVGVRGDPRSDIFALGVMLYQLLTGELPFGEPATTGGLRQRLWMDPKPVRQLNPEVPEWLQEIVMRCLESVAANRYPSAAHLAFDLRHPEQVKVTARGKKIKGTGFRTHFKRWIKAAGMQYEPSPLATEQIESVPIVMVAVPHLDVTDATLYSLRQAVERSLGTRPGAQLACVTVISGTSASNSATSETTLQRHYLNLLKQWAQGLHLSDHQVSYHVLESGDVANALIEYAKGNHVSVLVMGAATHGLQTQRWLATVPIKVAMDAPCTVILVKQALPFDKLFELANQDDSLVK